MKKDVRVSRDSWRRACALTWGDASPATGTQRRTAARVGSESAGDAEAIAVGTDRRARGRKEAFLETRVAIGPSHPAFRALPAGEGAGERVRPNTASLGGRG